MATAGAEKGPLRTDQVGTVTLRYWASARAAVGVECDVVPVGSTVSLTELRDAALALHPGAEKVLAVCSVLVDDLPVNSVDPGAYLVSAGSTVEFLPPFAGG